MDQLNEENTFEQMVDDVFPSKTKSQFILITPKPIRNRMNRNHVTYFIMGYGTREEQTTKPIPLLN
jgi:hypothetical protein